MHAFFNSIHALNCHTQVRIIIAIFLSHIFVDKIQSQFICGSKLGLKLFLLSMRLKNLLLLANMRIFYAQLHRYVVRHKCLQMTQSRSGSLWMQKRNHFSPKRCCKIELDMDTKVNFQAKSSTNDKNRIEFFVFFFFRCKIKWVICLHLPTCHGIPFGWMQLHILALTVRQKNSASNEQTSSETNWPSRDEKICIYGCCAPKKKKRQRKTKWTTECWNSISILISRWTKYLKIWQTQLGIQYVGQILHFSIATQKWAQQKPCDTHSARGKKMKNKTKREKKNGMKTHTQNGWHCAHSEHS